MYNQFQNGGPKVKNIDKFYSTTENIAENNDKNNRFDIGGPKNPPIKTTGGAGYVPATDASYLLDKVRNRLYRTVNPYGNYDIPGSVSDFLSGEDWASHMYMQKGPDGKYYTDTFEDVTSPIEVVDDIWANYLNIPEDKRRFKTRLEKSAYVPGMKGNPNLTYFKLPLADYDVDRLIEETDELPVGKNIISEDFSSYNLGEHTIGRGFDDNGEYRSYYDRWDLNPFNGKYGGVDVPFINSLSDTTMGIGKPVEIYDRIYMDDYYDMPKGQQKSLYLPEVTIYGGKRRSIRDILNGLNNSKPNKKKAFGGELYPDGGILGNVTRGMKVDTDQCATWSNRLLRNNGYLISGNAWNLNDVDTLFNGFAGLQKPQTYNRKDVEAYNHMASDNVYKNFDSSTLDKTKPYVVNMFYNNSPALQDAYNDGRNVTGTHTGLLTYDEDKKKWIVTHNIHGKIHQENFIPLQSGKGKYGVTAIYQPREDNIMNRIRGFFGFANGGYINNDDEFNSIMRPLNEYMYTNDRLL